MIYFFFYTNNYSLFYHKYFISFYFNFIKHNFKYNENSSNIKFFLHQSGISMKNKSTFKDAIIKMENFMCVYD
mgnify:CR=1 FL=1